MKRQIVLCVICVFTLLVGCPRNLTPEEQAKIQALKTDLEAIKKEVSAAEEQNAQYSGGIVNALLTLRLEILKTNEALIQQRIHAIESGAKVTIETVATKPDTQRAKQLEAELTEQEIKVSEADVKANLYSGGLVGVMAVMGAATERNTLAMLRQQYLIAKHGLASPQQNPSTYIASAQGAEATLTDAVPGPGPADEDADEVLREQILEATLLRKQFAEQGYQDYIFFDIAFNANGLDKPARAIKGVLKLTDLFGELKFAIKWTIEKPIAPSTTYTEKGSGFEYNQFIDSHHWVRSTEKENMKVKFRVDSILYEDGTTLNFD